MASLVGGAAFLALGRFLTRASGGGVISGMNRGRTKGLGQAALEVQRLLEPEKAHLLEVQREKKADLDTAHPDET